MNEIDDNELLYLIEENDEEALTKLIEKYTPKINAIILKYKSKALALGLDISDLYQEGLIGLMEGVKSFDKEKDASFKTFATILIEREILDILKRNDRMKYKSLNSAISMDNYQEDSSQSLYNVIEDNNTPEKAIISEELESELLKKLTEFELKVYELKIDGKTNNEISMIINKPIRSVENTITRIKGKIKQNFKGENINGRNNK